MEKGNVGEKENKKNKKKKRELSRDQVRVPVQKTCPA